MKKHIVIMTRGAAAEAEARFVEMLAPALGDTFNCHAYEGATAFRHLARCDVLVLLGADAPDPESGLYEPLSREAKMNFGAYVSSGRPLVATADGVGSFPEWPRFGELVGYEIVQKLSGASRGADEQNEATSAPCVGEEELALYAEPSTFCCELNGARVPVALAQQRVAPRPAMQTEVLARAHVPGFDPMPLVMCTQGGPRPGAGLSLYMGLGPAWGAALGPATLVRLWRRALLWLVGEAETALLAGG